MARLLSEVELTSCVWMHRVVGGQAGAFIGFSRQSADHPEPAVGPSLRRAAVHTSAVGSKTPGVFFRVPSPVSDTLL